MGLPEQDAVQMGARFQLNMTDDEIAALSGPAWQKAILTAMAHYGFYVADTTAEDTWAVVAESGQMYTSFGYPDPFVEFAKAQGIPLSVNQYQFPLAEGVDWSRLRVIDPCETQGTCQ
jgi:hypothetical protein